MRRRAIGRTAWLQAILLLCAAGGAHGQVPRLPGGAHSRWVIDQPEEVVGYLTIDPETIRDRLSGGLRFVTMGELADGGRGWAVEYLSSHPDHGERAMAILEIVRAGTFSIDGRDPVWPPDGAVALWFARVASTDDRGLAGSGPAYLLLDLWVPDPPFVAYMRQRGYPADFGVVRMERGVDGSFRGTVSVPGLELRGDCTPGGPVSGGAGSRGTQTFVPAATSAVRDTVIVAFAGHRIRDCREAVAWHLAGDHPLARGTFIGPSAFEWGYHLVGGTYRR